jgi:replicative DNA helicase
MHLNEGHGYRKKENRDIYQQAVILFLKRKPINLTSIKNKVKNGGPGRTRTSDQWIMSPLL